MNDNARSHRVVVLVSQGERESLDRARGLVPLSSFLREAGLARAGHSAATRSDVQAVQAAPERAATPVNVSVPAFRREARPDPRGGKRQ